MTLIFDLLILILLLLVVFSDAKKGFLRSCVGFARIFLAFAAAFCFSGVFAALLDRVWLFPSVHEAIVNALASAGDSPVSALPIGLRAIAAIGGVDLQKIVASTSECELAVALARPISRSVSATLAFVILLIGSYIALKLLVPLLSNAVRSFSLLKAADTVGGILFGIFHAFLLGWVLAFISGFLLSLFGASLEETYLIRFFNHVSPIKAVVWLFLR